MGHGPAWSSGPGSTTNGYFKMASVEIPTSEIQWQIPSEIKITHTVIPSEIKTSHACNWNHTWNIKCECRDVTVLPSVLVGVCIGVCGVYIVERVCRYYAKEVSPRWLLRLIRCYDQDETQ